MTLSDFEKAWSFVVERSSQGVMTVQNRDELEHIYNLAKGSQTYLEIGTAEGNSLYVMGHAFSGNLYFVDLGEPHTEKPRQDVIDRLSEKHRIMQVFGDSTYENIRRRLETKLSYNERDMDCYDGYVDCVLIDGGHDFATVLSDSLSYTHRVRKYVFWHDIQLPEVRAAYEWYKARYKTGKYSEFIKSDTFGYGILDLT